MKGGGISLGSGDPVTQSRPPSHIQAEEADTHHEDVAGGWDFPADTKKFHEIVKLAMNIPANGDGGGDGLDVGFLVEQFLDLCVCVCVCVCVRVRVDVCVRCHEMVHGTT